jgi:hypothetical protein
MPMVMIESRITASGDLALPVQVADLVGQQEPIHRDVVKIAGIRPTTPRTCGRPVTLAGY